VFAAAAYALCGVAALLLLLDIWLNCDFALH
jgi:hypothetical protein